MDRMTEERVASLERWADHACSGVESDVYAIAEAYREARRLLEEERRARTDLEGELAEARRWIADLQSGMYVNCVYCGHRYGPAGETPVSLAGVLREHVERCPRHPMAAERAANQVLVEALRVAKETAEERCVALLRVLVEAPHEIAATVFDEFWGEASAEADPRLRSLVRDAAERILGDVVPADVGKKAQDAIARFSPAAMAEARRRRGEAREAGGGPDAQGEPT